MNRLNHHILRTAFRKSKWNFSNSSSPLFRSSYRRTMIPLRTYSSTPSLTKDIIYDRIVEILESYDNIKQESTISHNASFSKDLGLDSLDTVELLLELENEFSILIPDNEADEIKTVQQAVDYIAAQEDSI
ncbi:BA75_03377T0 [Komagataella pastoris]|uniref:Acyl carrier protein n=1 Tax=Komagataella pastoris TaxID=4922 RepID=A0A1B2JE85_PICPA|nr:BA75_03377T0 [Komagataella pastoris]